MGWTLVGGEQTKKREVDSLLVLEGKTGPETHRAMLSVDCRKSPEILQLWKLDVCAKLCEGNLEFFHL